MGGGGGWGGAGDARAACPGPCLARSAPAYPTARAPVGSSPGRGQQVGDTVIQRLVMHLKRYRRRETK